MNNNTLPVGVERITDDVCYVQKHVIAVNLDAHREVYLRKLLGNKGVAEKHGKMFMAAFSTKEDAMAYSKAINGF